MFSKSESTHCLLYSNIFNSMQNKMDLTIEKRFLDVNSRAMEISPLSGTNVWENLIPGHVYSHIICLSATSKIKEGSGNWEFIATEGGSSATPALVVRRFRVCLWKAKLDAQSLQNMSETQCISGGFLTLSHKQSLLSSNRTSFIASSSDRWMCRNYP